MAKDIPELSEAGYVPSVIYPGWLCRRDAYVWGYASPADNTRVLVANAHRVLVTISDSGMGANPRTFRWQQQVYNLAVGQTKAPELLFYGGNIVSPFVFEFAYEKYGNIVQSELWMSGQPGFISLVEVTEVDYKRGEG